MPIISAILYRIGLLILVDVYYTVWYVVVGGLMVVSVLVFDSDGSSLILVDVNSN